MSSFSGVSEDEDVLGAGEDVDDAGTEEEGDRSIDGGVV